MEEELYDLSQDPDCLQNLALNTEFGPIKTTLHEQMESELRSQEDPRMFGKGYIFDQYKYVNPGDSSFYSRYMRGEKMKANWVNESDFETEPVE
jgi:hypothetical protein